MSNNMNLNKKKLNQRRERKMKEFRQDQLLITNHEIPTSIKEICAIF